MFALLEKHSATRGDHTDEEKHENRFKLVELNSTQTEYFDDGPGATRKWLWPFLGTEYHLVGFLRAEYQPEEGGI